MNLRQIEYFVKVAELSSFTRAAVLLGIPQPSLSRHVRMLEVELRHTLLHRNGRGVEVTPAGQCFLEHGRAVIESARQAVSALDDLRTDPQARVVIGLPTRIASVLTTPLVRAFRARFRKASITIAEGSSTVLHEWLLLGRVEIALLFNPPYSAELELEPLHSEDLVLVGSRNNTAKQPKEMPLKQIQDYPLILPRIPNATRAVLAAAAGRIGVEFNISVEVDTIQNILELIASRMGYGVLPLGAVKIAGGERRFRITRVHSPAIGHQLFLATCKHRRHTGLAGEMLRLISAINIARFLG